MLFVMVVNMFNIMWVFMICLLMGRFICEILFSRLLMFLLVRVRLFLGCGIFGMVIMLLLLKVKLLVFVIIVFVSVIFRWLMLVE